MRIYTFRLNAFVKTSKWILTENALVKSENNIDLLKIPYSNIQSIRLYYNPLRYRSYNYECEIKTLVNQKIKILSTSYDSFAVFLNQSDTYSPFIRELVKNVAAVNSLCKITTGLNHTKFIINYLFTVGMIIVFYLILASFVGQIIALFLVIGFLIITINYFNKNWPKKINNSQIPDEVLPNNSQSNS